LKRETLISLAAGIICALGGSAALFLFFRYGFGILLPFLIAWGISALVRGIASWLRRKTGLHSRAGNLIILLLLLFLLVWGGVWLGGHLIRQAGALVEEVGAYLEKPDNFFRRAAEKLNEWQKKWHPETAGQGGIGNTLYTMATELLSGGLSKVTSRLASLAADFIAALPKTVVGFVIGTVALFYLSLDYDRVRRGLAEHLPPGIRRWSSGVKKRMGNVFSGYVKAYFLLFLITYAELLLGLTFLRVRYAILVALIVAAVDVLPVLGVGTVLIPWSAVLFLSGDYYRAVGFLVLFGIIYAVRQVAESRLVGKCIGIHPLAALVAVYAGFRLFGLGGMILGPIAAYLVKWLLSGGKETAEPSGKEKKA